MKQSPSAKKQVPSTTYAVNTALLLQFGIIFVSLIIFLGLIFVSLDTTRETKEFVASENDAKVAFYQAAMNNEALQANLPTQVAQSDANIQKYEDELDATISIVMFLCMFNIVCVVIATVNTLNYVRNQVVAPMLQFKDCAAAMEQGQFSDLDFTCSSRATEVQQLSKSLNASTSEMTRFVHILEYALSRLCEKDFSEVPASYFPGELRRVEDRFLQLVGIVSETLKEIVVSAEEVTQGAQQVSSGAQTLAQGAAEQTSSVESLSVNVEEIAKMVSNTAESAVNANRLGAKASEVLDSSSREMEELMDAIAQIERSSSDIEQIIKTIDDIAFQTNILALNAAIEAARAGQFGKSFAVVADEVRSLAQKSAMAASDTNGLIDSSLEAIRRGAALAKSTNDAFAEVKDNSMQVLDVVEHISTSSQMQSSSIDSIHSSVKQISAVISSNSATSEESAAASQQLSGQAELMTDMLGNFKVEGATRVPDEMAKLFEIGKKRK